MAISTNTSIWYFGSETNLTDGVTTTLIATTAFSAADDTEEWTNSDDAPLAMFKLYVADWSAAPAAGTTIDIYAQLLNIQSTSDEPLPDASYKNHYLGSFVLDAADAAQYIICGPVSLPAYKTSQEYQFFLHNTTAVGMGTTDDEWDLWITPITVGPHA